MCVRHSWQSFSLPSMSNFNLMSYCERRTVQTAKLQQRTIGRFFFFCHQPAMHLFLHPDSLPIRNPASLIVPTDSLPLQERCKWEELWVSCYLAAPGSHPADNMLALSDESGSLCWTICFGFCLLVQNKTILNKAWRTCRRCLHVWAFWCKQERGYSMRWAQKWPDTASGKFYMSNISCFIT